MPKSKSDTTDPEAKYRLTNLNVVEIAFAGSPAVPKATFAVMKSTDLPEGSQPVLKTMLFKKDPVKKQVYGYVLVPDEADLQGDIISKEDVEIACHSLLINLAKNRQKGEGASENHEIFSPNIGQPIESCIDKAGSLAQAHGVDPIPGAWWLGMQCSDETWKKIDDGEFTGFSIGGVGSRVPIEATAPQAKSDSRDSLTKALTGFLAMLKGDAKVFSEVREERDAWEALWGSMAALEQSISSIYWDDTVEDKASMVAASIDQFKVALVAYFAVQKALHELSADNIEALENLAKASKTIKPLLERISKQDPLLTNGGEDMTTEELKALIAKVDTLVKTVEDVATRVGTIEESRKSDDGKKTDDDSKTAEALEVRLKMHDELSKSFADLTGKLDDIGKRLEVLEKTPNQPNGSSDIGNVNDDSKPDGKATTLAKATVGVLGGVAPK